MIFIEHIFTLVCLCVWRSKYRKCTLLCFEYIQTQLELTNLCHKQQRCSEKFKYIFSEK